MAFNVVDDKQAHQPILRPAWISADFDLPDPPVIANGVLFALSTGENPQQQHNQETSFQQHRRMEKESSNDGTERAGDHRAVLNAIDARTGKLLYQSGEAMKTCVHFSGLAVSDGRLYAVGHDSNTYCFGLKNSAQDGH